MIEKNRSQTAAETPVPGSAPTPESRPAADLDSADFPSIVSEPVGARAADDVPARIAWYERELKARGGDARLFHEIGRLWEEQQRSPRNAAVAYQNAYRIDPAFLTNLQSARTLFAEVGNWQMVAQLLEAEAEAVSEPAARARRLFERGLILEQRLGRAEEARACFDRALAVSPRDPGVLAHLESLLADGKQPQALAAIWLDLAAASQDPGLQAHYLASAAGLYEDRLGDPARALELYREAFANDRANPVILSQLQRHLERDGAWDELARVLAAQAQLAGAAAAPIHQRLARIHLKRGADDEAIASLLAARKLAPSDSSILAELATMYEVRGAWAELADVLEAKAATVRDESERVSVHLALGALYEERLERKDAAIAAYRAVVRLVPSHGPALSALGKLLDQAGDWEGLLATFEAEAAAAEDPRQRAGRLFKAAQLLSSRLGRQDEAIARYNEILSIVPGYLPAHEALVRLYEAQDRHAELVAMLEADLAAVTDRDHILSTLARIASIQEERLGDPSAAIATHERILRIAPDHLPTIRALARAAEKAGAWEQLLQAHELEAARTSDQRQVVSLLQRSAEILEERIGDGARAADTYRKVLDLAPTYLPALRALGKLYAKECRWAELIEMHRQEADVAPTAEGAAALTFKIGELYEHRLGDEDRAVAAYREVLILSPSHFPALRQLARIYRERDAWEELAEILLAEAASRTDPGERAAVLFQVAELWEERAARADLARDSYLEVLRAQPGHAGALMALERLHTQAGAWKELAHVFERELGAADPAGQLAAYLKLARLYLERLGEPSRAAQCCEAALALDDRNLFALKTLERIRTAQGDRARRAEIRGRVAGQLADPKMASALFLAAAADRERHAPGSLALEELARAVAADPEDERANELLERALRRRNDIPRIAALLESRASRAAGERKVAALLRLSEAREALGDRDGALAALREARSLEPANLPVLAGLCRLLAAAALWPELHETLRAQAGALEDRGHAIDALLEAARIAEEHLADQRLAEDDLRAVLSRDPLEPRAARRLEEVLAGRGGAEDVARLHEVRAAAQIQPAAAADAFVAAARLQLGELASPEKALELLDQALARVPHHAEALERRGEACFALGQHAEAAKSWAARVQLGGSSKALRPIHLHLGVLYAEHLGDPSRAVAHVQAALAADPGQREALWLLARLQLAAGNPAGAADALLKLAQGESDPATLLRIHADLARVREDGFGDLAGAAAALEKVVELAPESEKPLEKLAALYERMRDLPNLVKTLDRWATRTAPENPVRAASLRTRAGAVHAVPLRDPAGAIRSYEAALELNPADREARIALAELLSGNPDTFGRAAEQHRILLEADPLRVASYRDLQRIWQLQGSRDRSYAAGAVLRYLGAADASDSAWYAQQRASLPTEPRGAVPEADLRDLLLHPDERNALSEIARLIGDQLEKVLPPNLGRWQVGRGERLKAGMPLRTLLDRQLAILGETPDACEAYASPLPGVASVETTSPLSAVLGADLEGRDPREQAFRVGRVAWLVARRTAFVDERSDHQIVDLLAAAVHLHDPAYQGLGMPDTELARRLGKALSRKARKALEDPVRSILTMRETIDGSAWAAAAKRSADRAAMLLCGDIEASLRLAWPHQDRKEEIGDLLRFAVSDAHARLRTKLRLAI